MRLNFLWEGTVKAPKSERRCFERFCFFAFTDCCVVWKSIFKNILIFDEGKFGSNPVPIMGCIKFYWKDSHLHCVCQSFRSLYSTVHISLQNLLSRVCMMPETWKWLAVGRWHCGAAVRVMRIKKPFVRLGAFRCWPSCWRRLMKTCWFQWWGLYRNVHQRYLGLLCVPCSHLLCISIVEKQFVRLSWLLRVFFSRSQHSIRKRRSN